MSICIETITKPFLRLLDFSEPQFIIIIIIYYNILGYFFLLNQWQIWSFSGAVCVS